MKDARVTIKTLTALVACVTALAAWILLSTSRDDQLEKPVSGHGSGVLVVPKGEPLTGDLHRDVVTSSSPQPATQQPVNTVFATMNDLLAAHLKPAPVELQRMARDVFIMNANGYRKQVEDLEKEQKFDFESLLKAADARFCERLQRLGAEKLQREEGLLVVGDMKYQQVVGNSKFLRWSGGIQQFSQNTDVLVYIEPPDPQLEQLDKIYWDLRAVQLAQLLTPFNSLTVDQRYDAIQRFREARKAHQADPKEFGVGRDMLPYIVIDASNMIVLPREYKQ